MHKECLICGQDSKKIALNNLGARECNGCGLIWLENFDLPDNHYEESKIDLTREKIQERLLDSKDRLNIFKRYARLDNLCDMGCGDGSFLMALKQSGYKNVLGIDPNVEACECGLKNNLEIFRGRIEDFPKLIRNRNINTITMFHLIEHMVSPRETLKFIYGNMKKGDRLIIETPNIGSYPLKKANYVHRLVYCGHFFYFNIKNLNKLLTDIGFKIVALGKRDFNRRNLTIKESLFRLGFLSPRGHKEITNPKFKTRKQEKHFIGFFIKNIIRKILSRIVILSGRVNYIWIVAEK